jgi:NADPH:quinone reductase-like Zn-dependent oxidoreductase
MPALFLTGTGGPEKLVYRDDAPLPVIKPSEVLVEVAAAGLNRTDVNTRLGWYDETGEGAGWAGEGLRFPLIQGADVCGRIVATGSERLAPRLGERVVIQPCLVSQRKNGQDQWLGSERPGGFAGYVAAPAADTHRIESALSDAELASLPCAFGTAQNLLMRAGLKAGERIGVTGASGGLGSALVLLAKAQGAEVLALASAKKAGAVARALGVTTLSTDEDLGPQLGGASLDLVADVVGGPLFARVLKLLKTGGRYATSGAAGGAQVALDLRTLYLRDITLIGATSQSRRAFVAMLDLVERGAVRPLPVRTFPLADFHAAQRAFEAREEPGSVVVIPPR